MLFNKHFKNKFSALVDSLGIKRLETCAKLIGITREACMAAYEYGVVPSTKALVRIADFFGVSVAYLISTNDEKTSKE